MSRAGRRILYGSTTYDPRLGCSDHPEPRLGGSNALTIALPGESSRVLYEQNQRVTGVSCPAVSAGLGDTLDLKI